MLTLVIAAALAVQDAHAHPAASSAIAMQLAQRPVTLRTGIGRAHDNASTSSKQAQAFYDQGLAYLHSYVWVEAARSFHQALRIDPALALAHIGLTIADTELNAGDQARAELAKARQFARSDHDRRHVETRALQMAAEDAPTDPSRLAAYRSALDAALVQFPDDAQLWLARGLAESADPAERGQGSVTASVRFYDKARVLAPEQFAAHHYLTHSYENSARLDDALTEAQIYSKMAPGVPHARHMCGHELRRIGRVTEAIEEFRAADALESAYFEAEKIPVEYDWHYQHNLDLLATSYQYVGRVHQAEALMTRSFAIASSMVVQEFNKREWPVFLIGRGRATEALEAARVLAGHRSPLVSATGHVESGRAYLALGRYKEAADEGNAALHLMRGVEGAGLVANALQSMQGEFLLRTGQGEKARQMLRDVVRKERAAPGPDAWTQTLFTIEAIARTARDVGDWDLADWAAKQMFEHDPNYPGTHYALGLVAQHRGDRHAMSTEFALASKGWSQADPDLPELKVVRQP